jgi:hypothetical protein
VDETDLVILRNEKLATPFRCRMYRIEETSPEVFGTALAMLMLRAPLRARAALIDAEMLFIESAISLSEARDSRPGRQNLKRLPKHNAPEPGRCVLWGYKIVKISRCSPPGRMAASAGTVRPTDAGADSGWHSLAALWLAAAGMAWSKCQCVVIV